MKLIVLFFSLFFCGQLGYSTFSETDASEEASSTDSTPVDLPAIFALEDWTGQRAWRAPNYSHQEKSLGYSAQDFTVSESFRRRVNFWKFIYTELSTQEGVLHDSEDVDRILARLHFQPIQDHVAWTAYQKRHQKERLVDLLREEISNRLVSFMKIPSDYNLSAEEKMIWRYAQDLKFDIGPDSKKIQKRIRFQLGQKDRFQEGIFLSGRYIEDFEKTFMEEDLPIELTRLVFVESSFNVMARSKVGASGLWQIMPVTARPYRLIKGSVDYRNDPHQATKLAAKLLKMNYSILGSWPLAITAYNHGAMGVKKMTVKYKTESLAALIDNAQSRKSFGFASKNFYASFLAALEVEKNANQYFPKIVWSKPLPVTPFRLPYALTANELLEIFGQHEKKMEQSNPHLSRNKVIPAQSLIYIPEEKISELTHRSQRKPADHNPTTYD